MKSRPKWVGEHRIDYDSPAYDTPLHLAAYHLRDKDNLEQGLRFGADSNIVLSNDAGEAFTPAALVKYGNDDSYDLLKAVIV